MRFRSLACNLQLLVCIVFMSCVIPPPTEHEGGNTPPQVQKRGTIPEPYPSEPFVWYQTNTKAPAPLVMTFTIRVFDPDSESVYSRFFLNGDYATYIPDSNNEMPPVSSGLRAGQVDITGLCDDLVDKQIGVYDIDAYLSDSGFVDEGQDLRITRTVDGRKGSRDHVRWRVDCQLPRQE